MSRRTFTIEDQVAFAQLSGDYNPLHVDSIAARRYLFGQPVVHGIHGLLWALDEGLADRPGPARVSSLKARFLQAIPLDRPVEFADTGTEADTFDLSLRIEGSRATRIQGRLQGPGSTSPAPHLPDPRPEFPEKMPPHELSADDVMRASGALDLYLQADAAKRLFPHLVRALPAAQLAALLATTRLVGVICPGLHSLYSKLDLVADPASSGATLDYSVEKFDERFGLTYIKVVGAGMAGVIGAFLRPRPQEQPDSKALLRHVLKNEFNGQRALVIGGSRGLGEVTGKLLAAGGAAVRITYHRGRDDARRIVDDIVSQGGTAGCFACDVLSADPQLTHLAEEGWKPTHLYYFATPFIEAGTKGEFSSERFTRLCDYYVGGLVGIARQARSLGVKNFFCPSTVLIDELPPTLGEYAAAKMAGEMAGAFLEKHDRDLTIHRPRLPRMATDQTSSVMPVDKLDPAPVLIAELREMQRKSRAG